VKNNPVTRKAAQQIVSTINGRLKGRTSSLVVALDGGSGAGKSTLAAEVASHVGATVIQCDAFFDATITDEEWDTYTSEWKCRRCIDWQRLHKEALLPLIAGESVQYHPFSFSAENGLDSSSITKKPSKVIILDGIYSALPEFSDVVDFKVLVDVLPEVRRYRHNVREGHADEAWHKQWDPAEDYYFSVLCPPASFDLIVVNGEGTA